MEQLWLGPLPPCAACTEGAHSKCPDLYFREGYGLMACGCEDIVHSFESIIERFQS